MENTALQTIQNLDGFTKIMEAVQRLNDVRSAADLEALYLRGDGLSPATYSNYRRSVIEFYEFTEQLNPLQISPGHIEQYYEHLRKRLGANAASNQMAGLKKFFAGIQREIPIYKSPFDTMAESIKKKISQKQDTPRTKAALSFSEWDAVKNHLAHDRTVKGLQNRAMILTLYSTGLRAAELCSLRWGDLSKDDQGYYLRGIGKGHRPFCQRISATTLSVIHEAFEAQFHRAPKDSESLFYSTESYHGKPPARMNKSTLWVRLNHIGQELKASGELRKDVEFSAHLFRRSAITHQALKNVPMKQIQAFSRHRSIQVLNDNYIDIPEPAWSIIDQLVA